MALSSGGVDSADATSVVRETSSILEAGAAEGDSATSSSASSRRAAASKSPLSHGKSLDDAPLPFVHPSGFAPESLSSLCPCASESHTTQCLAEQAGTPSLLIICLSPELLRSPTCPRPRQQEAVEEHQPALYLQQAGGHQQQSSQQYTQEGREDEKEHTATVGEGTLPSSSRVSLPADSAGYVFLAEQFLPSLGLVVGDGTAPRQEKVDEMLLPVFASPAGVAHAQQGGTLGTDTGDQEQSLGVSQEGEQYEELPSCEKETDLPFRRQHLLQPRLRQLPATCMLRTKYYEAPLRLLYQFFEPPLCDSVESSTTAGSPAAGVSISSPQYLGSRALLHLGSPPEAVLLLCSSLADLYRAHELLDPTPQERLSSKREHCNISRQDAAIIAAAAEGAQRLPLPQFLRQPPYVVLRGYGHRENHEARAAAGAPEHAAARAGIVGKPHGSGVLDTGRGTTERAEGRRTAEGCTNGESKTAAEERAMLGSWLSAVPVKLLVCFDADQKEPAHKGQDSGEGNAAANTCSSFPSYDCYEDYEDPSVMLFFEDACFLEKVSLSLPTPRLRGHSNNTDMTAFSFVKKKKEAQALAGTTAAEASASASMEVEASNTREGTREKASWCSVRPLLGTALPLLRSTGASDGNVRALQRVVEALHCHMWPNMRLLKNNSTHCRRDKAIASPAREKSTESRSHVSSSHDRRKGERSMHSIPSGDGGSSKHTDAGTGSAIREERKTGVGAKGEAVGPAEPHGRRAPATRYITSPLRGHCVITGKTTSAKLDQPTSDGAPTLAAGDHTTEGGLTPSYESTQGPKPRGRGLSTEDKGERSRKKPPEETSFHGWDSFARTVRETRLEAPQLSRAERTAKAEILTLQLAHALGISDDEDVE